MYHYYREKKYDNRQTAEPDEVLESGTLALPG